MSNPQTLRPRPGTQETAGGATTTLVRAEPRPQGEQPPELHPQLRAQLRELQLRTGRAEPDVAMLLQLVNDYYHSLDGERRGIAESMRLMADEARALAVEAHEQSSEQLQVILDHIKDVVLAVDEEGVVRTFNPTGERVFGYDEAEVLGQRIDLLLPQIASSGETIPDALRRLAATLGDTALDLAACELQARRKSGEAFPAEIAVSKAPLSRREMFVLCLRDVTERREAEQAVRDSEARYRLLVDHAPDAIVVLDVDTGCFVDANDVAQRLFGLERARLLERGPFTLSPALQSDGSPSAQRAHGYIQQALAGEVPVFEWTHCDAAGQEFICEVRLVRLPSAHRRLVRGSITDISERKRAERIAAAERKVFEQVTRNAPLAEVLGSITRLIESAAAGTISCVSVLAEDRQAFSYMIAPQLPQALRTALEHARIDIRNGSCAAAVYLDRQVLVPDIGTDPFWAEQRAAALAAQLRAAWSTPIKAAGGKLLGALGVYREEVGLPSAPEAQIMARAAQLAGIAIERHLAEQALRGSEAKFRGLFESIAEGVYQSTREGRLLSVNPAFVAMLGYSSAEEMYALASAEVLYWNPADRAEFTRRVEAEGEIRDAEFLLRTRDGQQLVTLENARLICDAHGRIAGYEGTLVNITERKRAEQAIFAEKERAQVTLESIGDAVISTDAEGCIEYINPVAESLTAWSLAEARGQPIGAVLKLVNELTREPIENSLSGALGRSESGAPADHAVLITRSGHEVAIQESAAPICDRGGRVIGAVVVFHDVTRERRLKRALSYQASHDALTGLINRREFDTRLHAALLSAQRGAGPHALLYIDLDQFKVVNDTCGHQAGDRLLRDVTGLLQTRVRASDVIARLGGDEFGVLLESCSLEQATRIAEGVRLAIRDFRFVWSASTLSVGASIGIVQIRAETENVANIMSAADIACYAAKDAGRNRIHVYEAEGVPDRHREMHWVARVTRAVEDKRLELFFQPIVALGSSGERAFHEITVRLRDDNGELVPPSEFLPAAERYNVMSVIDRQVVGQAIELLRERLRRGLSLPLLAVNLSGASLNEQSFVDFALQSVAEPSIASALCFEITETAAVTSLANARYVMGELKRRGCKFALDDFGTGVSSFLYLKTLPVNFLKIDGQFIGPIAQEPVNRSMVEAIAKVARALNIATIAECVESEAVLTDLRRLGVDFAQGFYLAQPLPIAQLPK
ncbi:MAG TPA: PAS domain S-box protein [Steroidobacteraceae bacterium]|jgi:diguanylate cyclase (GGDEF)-like protein/PAS domain S-box-containing protein|nr:PAS domain S-box protein [Steroidobacteraceae bacterium]